MQIRLATAADAPVVAELFSQIYEDMELPVLADVSHQDLVQALTTLYQKPAYLGDLATTIVAEQDQQIVGAVFGHPASTEMAVNQVLVATTKVAPGFKAPLSLGGESQEPEWYLSMIVVNPKFQGHGIGQQLLAALPKFVKAPVIGLNVAEANPTAERLYQRVGYKRTGTLQLGGHPYFHLQKQLTVPK